MPTSIQDKLQWRPPFCPNPKCPFHHHRGGPWPYHRIGTYQRQQPPYCIQRFACRTCRRTFSTQTFSTTYWQKLPQLDAQIFMKTVGGMANRQIARDLRHSPETINRHLARLGRHCLLLHQSLLKNAPAVSSAVIDGFESFELSQYYPFHHHLAVEKGTDFFIFFTDSELRRKGRMTPHQKARRQELEQRLGRPDPKAVEKDMRHLLQVTFAGAHQGTLWSDDHPAYRRSLQQITSALQHKVTPGTAHRDRNNPLWEINLLDLLIRHSSANHKRQTIAWSKRRQASAERLAILLIWRNYCKGRREKDRASPTPAMARGMMAESMEIEQVLRGRLFRSQTQLPQRWSEYYDRTVSTRALPRQRRHDLKYAY